MNQSALSKLACNAPATESDIRHAEGLLGIHFPHDYATFLRTANGAEGSLGPNAYVRIWRVEELALANEEYAVEEFAPGLLFFASDGGDEGYAFDKQASMAVVQVPFVGMSRDEVTNIAATFDAFIDVLSSR